MYTYDERLRAVELYFKLGNPHMLIRCHQIVTWLKQGGVIVRLFMARFRYCGHRNQLINKNDYQIGASTNQGVVGSNPAGRANASRIQATSTVAFFFTARHLY